MLLAPAVGGLLSDPLTQYPEGSPWMEDEWVVKLLMNYPFVLPNLVAAIVCLISVILVILCVEETLPEEKRRPVIYIIPDMLSWIHDTLVSVVRSLTNFFSSIVTRRTNNNEDNTTTTESNKVTKTTTTTSSSGKTASPVKQSRDRGHGNDDIEANNDHNNHNNHNNNHDTEKHDGHDNVNNDDELDSIAMDVKILESTNLTLSPSVLSTRASRASFSAAVRNSKDSPKTDEEKQFLLDDEQKERPLPPPVVGEATIKSLLSNSYTFDHLMSYWINGFVNVATNGAFPLFAMSLTGGLGLTETSIGLMGTISGLIFCFCQYFVFTTLMDRRGLYGSMRLGALLANLPVALFPFALLIGNNHRSIQIMYLSTLMSIMMVFNSVFYACISIATIRTVDTSHRATLNGLSSLGASLGRGAGPIVAGWLVAFSMSPSMSSSDGEDHDCDGLFDRFHHRLVPAKYGSIIVYSVLALLGYWGYSSTRKLNDVGSHR